MSQSRPPIWRRPMVQLAASVLVALLVLIGGSFLFSRQAATDEAIGNARSACILLARSVAEPGLPKGIMSGNVAALDRFDRLARNRMLHGDVLRIKIWTESGMIVYSDKIQLIGRHFDLGNEEWEVVAKGGADAEVSDADEPENIYERNFGKVLEVYTQIHAPNGTPLLFEAYFDYNDVNQRSHEILADFWPITVIGALLFVGLAGPLVWVLTRRLEAAAAQRERLLMAAVEASDGERRRIARDIHDGVVQDLAGISFTASATARTVGDDSEVGDRLDEIGGRVRQSLRRLRSLLVEIYPPDLHSEGLASALDDLLAPAAASGVDVSVQVDDTSDVSAESVAIIWRVAQEAVRNASRHAHATQLDVAVRVDGVLSLAVTDNGIGFDQTAPPPEGHLGIRGLRDLVAEGGGSLTIDSVPGRGTRVRVEVPL